MKGLVMQELVLCMKSPKDHFWILCFFITCCLLHTYFKLLVWIFMSLQMIHNYVLLTHFVTLCLQLNQILIVVSRSFALSTWQILMKYEESVWVVIKVSEFFWICSCRSVFALLSLGGMLAI